MHQQLSLPIFLLRPPASIPTASWLLGWWRRINLSHSWWLHCGDTTEPTVLFFYHHQGTADYVSSQKQPELYNCGPFSFSVLQSQEGSADIPPRQMWPSHYSEPFWLRACRKVSEGEKEKTTWILPFKLTYNSYKHPPREAWPKPKQQSKTQQHSIDQRYIWWRLLRSRVSCWMPLPRTVLNKQGDHPGK